jgi:hypothetical protein
VSGVALRFTTVGNGCEDKVAQTILTHQPAVASHAMTARPG